MKQTFEIPGKLSGLNEYTRSNRSNRYQGAAVKRANQDIVVKAIKMSRVKQHEGSVTVAITWIEPNMRRDPDNVRFAAKFVLDALVETQIIKNDTQRYVIGIRDTFLVNKANPRVIVELEDA